MRGHARRHVVTDKKNVVAAWLVSDHYHVSRLLNFLVTTLPMSMPRRSTIRWARSGCEVPLKTLMFGILLCKTRTREFSKFARNKLLARTGCDTGITTTESTGAVGQSVIARVPDVTSLEITLRLRARGYLCAQNGAGLSYRDPSRSAPFAFLAENNHLRLNTPAACARARPRVQSSLGKELVSLMIDTASPSPFPPRPDFTYQIFTCG